MRIQNVPFRVVGVADRKGQSPGGNDYDDVVYVPVSTFLAKIQGGLQNYIAGTIMVEVTADDQTGRGRRRASPSCCATATTSPPAPTTTSRSRT